MKVRELETLLDQRSRELAEVADQRSGLEARLADGCEVQLRSEKNGLAARLAELQVELDERSAEVIELRKARAELEGMVALEKESFAHRVQLFKEEMQESRRAQHTWQEREEELTETVQDMKNTLARQERETARQTDGRGLAEREAERLPA